MSQEYAVDSTMFDGLNAPRAQCNAVLAMKTEQGSVLYRATLVRESSQNQTVAAMRARSAAEKRRSV